MRNNIRWTPAKIQKRIEFIEPYVYTQKAPLPAFRYRVLQDPTTPTPMDLEKDNSTWDLIHPGDFWGPPRTNFILRTNFRVPLVWVDGTLSQGKNHPVALFLPIGIAGDFSHPEALVYIDGEPYAACDRHHQEIILPGKFCDGNTHSLALHGWTGIGSFEPGGTTQMLQMHQCELVLIHQATRDLLAVARVALGISVQLEERDPSRHHLLNALDLAFRMLDIRIPVGDGFYNSVPEAYQTLRQGLQKAGYPLDVRISAVGHAHIDVAWLWTLGQTRQKAARTFLNVLRQMEQFPEFIFAQSQPQLYDYLRKDFPTIFKEIKKKVLEGRWETIGGMWVEADCNLSGPESLVRQFLLGRKFFRENFGKDVDSPVLWLPDVFGYAWNLPQLIKEAGLEYFFTIKIGWSEIG